MLTLPIFPKFESQRVLLPKNNERDHPILDVGDEFATLNRIAWHATSITECRGGEKEKDQSDSHCDDGLTMSI